MGWAGGCVRRPSPALRYIAFPESPRSLFVLMEILPYIFLLALFIGDVCSGHGDASPVVLWSSPPRSARCCAGRGRVVKATTLRVGPGLVLRAGPPGSYHGYIWRARSTDGPCLERQ